MNLQKQSYNSDIIYSTEKKTYVWEHQDLIRAYRKQAKNCEN